MQHLVASIAGKLQNRQQQLHVMVLREKLKIARRQRRQELVGVFIDSISETTSL